jgi:hypothetical protein
VGEEEPSAAEPFGVGDGRSAGEGFLVKALNQESIHDHDDYAMRIVTRVRASPSFRRAASVSCFRSFALSRFVAR